MRAKTAKKARHADVEQAMVEQAQPVSVTDVAAQGDTRPAQTMPIPMRRSSAARFMADLLKPIAMRIAAQTPKAHLWELIKFLNAVDHGNAPAARALADSMLELTLAMRALEITTNPAPVAAEAPAATGQQLRTSAARFAADLLKPVATRIGARTPKAIAWELIKFYNALDHCNQEFATARAQALYSQTIIMVDQLTNQRLCPQASASTPGAASDEESSADDLLPNF